MTGVCNTSSQKVRPQLLYRRTSVRTYTAHSLQGSSCCASLAPAAFDLLRAAVAVMMCMAILASMALSTLVCVSGSAAFVMAQVLQLLSMCSLVL